MFWAWFLGDIGDFVNGLNLTRSESYPNRNTAPFVLMGGTLCNVIALNYYFIVALSVLDRAFYSVPIMIQAYACYSLYEYNKHKYSRKALHLCLFSYLTALYWRGFSSDFIFSHLSDAGTAMPPCGAPASPAPQSPTALAPMPPQSANAQPRVSQSRKSLSAAG